MMIYSDKQYRITNDRLELLTLTLNSLQSSSLPQWLMDAQKNALTSQIEELSLELKNYLSIKQGQDVYPQSTSTNKLARKLIQARISQNITQEDLAKKLNIETKKIQQLETSDYLCAGSTLTSKIADILGVSSEEVSFENIGTIASKLPSTDSSLDIFLDNFPINEMIKRGWIKIKDGLSNKELLTEYLSSSIGQRYAMAFHRKGLHGDSAPNEYALLAWQARVIEKAKAFYQSNILSQFQYNDTWIKELVCLSTQDNVISRVKDLLASKGIILIFEKHLQGTYLDGAAMMLDSGNPVIALTLRHDRLDNFWFVLMHELGHVFLHLVKDFNIEFFDEEDNSESNIYEKEADLFALNSLVSPDAWESCLSRFSMTPKSVIADANNLGIHPSIVAGRIRKERNDYKLFNNLIGQGTVRNLSGEY